MIQNRVRAICLRLPGVQEVQDGHGHIAFRVKGRSVARLSGYSNELISIKTDLETQEFLIAKGDYAKASHIGRLGWVTHKAEFEVDWSEVDELIRAAHERIARGR